MRGQSAENPVFLQVGCLRVATKSRTAKCGNVFTSLSHAWHAVRKAASPRMWRFLFTMGFSSCCEAGKYDHGLTESKSRMSVDCHIIDTSASRRLHTCVLSKSDYRGPTIERVQQRNDAHEHWLQGVRVGRDFSCTVARNRDKIDFRSIVIMCEKSRSKVW